MTMTNNQSDLKHCPRCRTRRDPSWFSSDWRRPDGLSCWCKPCSRRAWRERAWGITEEEFNQILSRQGGGCGICGTPLQPGRPNTAPDSIRVDRTDDGRIRGFLCAECRTGLRGFRGDVGRLRRAVEYLGT